MDGDEEPRNVDELALSEKKAQFRLVRRLAYAVEGVVILALLYIVWVQAGGNGGTDTLFIPLPALMFMMLFGALLLNITGVAFGALEVHAAGGGEQRYLIARHSMSTAIVTAVFAAFFLIVIALLGPVIDEQIDYEKRIELGYQASQGTVRAPFDVTSDYTGSSYLSWVEIQATNVRPFSVLIYDHADYTDNYTLNAGKELLNASGVTYFKFFFVNQTVLTVPAANHTTPKFDRLTVPPEAGRYSIVIERIDYAPADILYRQDRVLDPAFVGSVYLLLYVLIALNIGAAVYNRAVRNKWRGFGVKNY